MWPRLIAQLVELLPHATRLLPMADNYLASRRETDRAQTQALTAMGEGLRGEINDIAVSHSALSRQLAEQKQQIEALKDAVEAGQTQNITQTKQLEWITTDVNTLRVWVKFGTVIIILLLIALGALSIQILHSH
jgi:septal ring factor EnvC (AmiA/AmiB activator)